MKRKRLGEILIQSACIDEQALQLAIHYQKKYDLRLGESIIQLRLTDEKKVYQALAQSLELPFTELTRLQTRHIDRQLFKIIPREVARLHNVVPISFKEVDGRERFIVATSDPTNIDYLRELSFEVNRKLFLLVSTPKSIRHYLKHVYPQSLSPTEQAIDEDWMAMFPIQSFDQIDEDSVSFGLNLSSYEPTRRRLDRRYRQSLGGLDDSDPDTTRFHLDKRIKKTD